MTSESSSNITRTAAVGGLLLAVVAVIWFFNKRSPPMSRPEPSLASLQAELAAIGPPAGFKLAGPVSEEARIGTVVISQKFELPQSSADARAHFRTELLAHGWQLNSEDTASPWSDRYCKSSLAADVKLVQETAVTSSLALTISWNQLSLAFCGGGASNAKPS